jgi:hypothetical protein
MGIRLLPKSLALSLTAEEVPDQELTSRWPVDRNYWLGHCQGFHVDGPGGHVGVVDHVVYSSRLDRPDVVAVSSGIWRIRSTDVPVHDVAEVFPEDGRVMLRAGGRQRASVRAWARHVLHRGAEA